MPDQNQLARLTQAIFFANVFIAESMFRQRDILDKSIDFQVILKMGIWVGTFFICLYFIRYWLHTLLRFDKFFEVSLLIIITISCFYAPNVPYSLASAFSLIAIFLMMFQCSAILSNKQILHPFFSACTLVSFLSIVVYFVSPSFGRMGEWVDGVHVTGWRLSGITGTANVIGYISACSLLALYYYRRFLPHPYPLWYWIFVGLNLAALLMSNSRTSLIALILSLIFSSMLRLTTGRLSLFFAGVLIILIGAISVDHDWLFSQLSRSGDAAEITSGTGRTAIWKATLQLIAEKPWFGWGYASSGIILPEHRDLIGYEAAHTHNAFLQVAFSNGIVGLFFFVGIFLVKLFYAIKSRDQLNTAFIIFLLIDGMTEIIAFNAPATTSTIVLATVLSLKYGDTGETYYRTPEQRLPGPAQSAQDASDSEPR